MWGINIAGTNTHKDPDNYYKSIREIYYNKSFFEKHSTKSEHRWVIASILAHEIGHHVLKHDPDFLKESNRDPEIELAADRYSGEMLGLMGADKEQSQKALHIIDLEHTMTNPSKFQRLAAVEEGHTLGKNNTCINNGNCQIRHVSDNFQGTVMHLIPVGDFKMGSQNGDADETPIHTAKFHEPFWLDRTEVTRRAYQDCIDDKICSSTQSNLASTENNQPINMIPWG